MSAFSGIKFARSTSDVDELMGGSGTEPGCVLTTGEWANIGLKIGSQRIPALMKPIAVMQKYVERVIVNEGVIREKTFRSKRGLSKVVSMSLEAKASAKGSIQGWFEWNLEASTHLGVVTDQSEEWEETSKEQLHGPLDFRVYQQVIFYAFVLGARASDETRRSLVTTFKNTTLYYNDRLVFYIVPAWRDRPADRKEVKVPTLFDEDEFIEYLADAALRKWKSTPMGPLEGKAIKIQNADPIYLVLDGKLRHIANPTVYTGLFGNNYAPQIMNRLLVGIMPQGPDLKETKPLQKLANNPAIYLIDEGKKRLISDMFSFYKYHFSLSSIVDGGARLTNMSAGLMI